MKTLSAKNRIVIVLGACLLAEALSFAAFFRPAIGLAILALVAVLAAWLTLKDLRYGLLLVAAEIAIGSQGYLFSADGQAGGLSLRIMLWIIVMAVWLGREATGLLSNRQWRAWYRSIPYRLPLSALLLSVALGITIALMRGNDGTYLFLEAKRWAYALIILPFVMSFRRREDVRTLLLTVGAATLWLALKTLFAVYVFSHTLVPLTMYLYDWSRQDLLAEITRAAGGFYRIFMQSQIFLIPVLFMSLAGACLPDPAGRGRRIWYLVASVLLSAALIVSLSRSFWIATLLALLLAGMAVAIAVRPSLRRYLSRSVLVISLGAAGAVLLFAVVRFPFPSPSAAFDADLLRDRATQMEAGAASRWSLLPVMGKEIVRSPLWGYGFGKTLTYTTSDPRITSSTTDGRYTTYAFEWGWLDIALKLGLIGVAAYLWLFAALFAAAWRMLPRDPLHAIIIAASLLALAAVHFFTPYLNHPLGFVYLALVMVALQAEKAGKSQGTAPLSKI